MDERDQPTRVTRRGQSALAIEQVAPVVDDELRRIGPYVLLKALARGGMGDVWTARHVGPAGFEHMVALKRIHPHLVHDEHSREMFLREARAGSHLNHPNTVSLSSTSTWTTVCPISSWNWSRVWTCAASQAAGRSSVNRCPWPWRAT
ncbi:MAG: hypothetical protein ABIJ09_16140 [Pseudomonadota bacterium]